MTMTFVTDVPHTHDHAEVYPLENQRQCFIFLPALTVVHVFLFFFFCCFCLFCQVSPSARKWADSRMYSSPVLQAEVQPAAKIPPPTLSTGGAGAEAYLPAPGGEKGFKDEFIFI